MELTRRAEEKEGGGRSCCFRGETRRASKQRSEESHGIRLVNEFHGRRLLISLLMKSSSLSSHHPLKLVRAHIKKIKIHLFFPHFTKLKTFFKKGIIFIP